MPAERGPSGTGHERPPVAVPGPAPVPHPDEDRHGPHPSTEGAADPVVSPADAIRRGIHDPSRFQSGAECQAALDALDVLLAVGERDSAPELGPVPTDAGGPGKEETYWLRRKLQASIRHLRDIEDYYRLSAPSGSYNEQRADRARVLYEQITADFLHGKLDVPPEIVALRDAGERDRQQIARLTEALAEAERVIRVTAGWNPDRVSVLQAIEPAAEYLRAAVLAGEEDARPTKSGAADSGTGVLPERSTMRKEREERGRAAGEGDT